MTAPLPITAEQIERMKRMKALGMTTRGIAESFSISEQRASEFINGRKKRPRQYRGKPKPETKEVTLAHNQYEALEMKRRGLPLQYIAAKTRLKYSEIAAL
jgi:uncharacterized protein YpbB